MYIKKLHLLMLLSLIGCTKPETFSIVNTPVLTTAEPTHTTPSVSTLPISCLDVTNGFPEGTKLSGKLVMDRSGKYGILDLSDNTFTEIPEFVSYVSPSGEKIASYTFNENIHVTNENGETLRVFPWNKKWTEANSVLYSGVTGYETHLVSFQWWNKDTLAIASLPEGSQFMLNVNTGEMTEITFPYSDELYALGSASDSRSGFVLFSPALDHVLYSLTAFTFTMRQLNGKNPALWTENIGYTPANPVWSPDGQLLALAIGERDEIDNIHLVDTIGQDSRITNLNNMFDNPYKAYIKQIEWSPDGRKIALNVDVRQTEEMESNRLLVLDWRSGQIIDYCTPDPNNPYHDSGDFSVMWSPDGKYIATETTIINPETRKAYRIPNVFIKNWVGVGKN